MVLQEKATETQ